MDLRPELQFPALEETKVNRLAELAASIDGARPGEWEEELAEFNELAGTSFEFSELQGIYGGMEHDTWVRNILCMAVAERPLELTDGELLELISRLCSGPPHAEHEMFFWIKLLETNLDSRISDLIYWPGEYFGDGNNARQLSPAEILTAARNSHT
jgi:hypothetical protein